MNTATPACLEPDLPKCLHNITRFSTLISTRASSHLKPRSWLKRNPWRVLHAFGLPGFDPVLEGRKEAEDLKDFYTLFLHNCSSFAEITFWGRKSELRKANCPAWEIVIFFIQTCELPDHYCEAGTSTCIWNRIINHIVCIRYFVTYSISFGLVHELDWRVYYSIW